MRWGGKHHQNHRNLLSSGKHIGDCRLQISACAIRKAGAKQRFHQPTMKQAIILTSLFLLRSIAYGNGEVYAIKGNGTEFDLGSTTNVQIVSCSVPALNPSTTYPFSVEYFIDGAWVVHNHHTGQLGNIPNQIIPNCSKVKLNAANGFLIVRCGSLNYLAGGSSAELTPTNSIVLPESSTGQFQLILESSTDLITWTAIQPGIINAPTSFRFFRSRLVKLN